MTSSSFPDPHADTEQFSGLVILYNQQTYRTSRQVEVKAAKTVPVAKLFHHGSCETQTAGKQARSRQLKENVQTGWHSRNHDELAEGSTQTSIHRGRAG